MIVIGIDVSDLTFTASCATGPGTYLFEGQTFDQTVSGWNGLLALINTYRLSKSDMSVCMEATGVYSERISHFLHAQEFPVYVEPPRIIKKAFYEADKTDFIDSRQIAQYPFRFPDRIHPWQPPQEIIDHLKTLLTARELIIKNRTACKNTYRSLKKKAFSAGRDTKYLYHADSGA